MLQVSEKSGDAFIRIKNNIESIRKAVTDIKSGNIPLLNIIKEKYIYIIKYYYIIL
jgi:hypothetical protein